MDATDYCQWLENIQYGMQPIAALQFWTADLDAHTLSSTIEEVYSASFTQHQHTHLHQQPEEILFSCFVGTLNAAI